MTELSAELRKAHQMLANMAAVMPEPDGRPEYERHRDAYRIWSEQFPEHRFPAPVAAATEAYQALLDSGIHARRIAVGGDSAGGGLAIALLLRLRELGIDLPAAATPVSPWTDLTVTAPSYVERPARDPFVSQAALAKFARSCLGDADPTDPLASPVFGGLSGLPPLHIEVGTKEVLIDSRRLYKHALRDGVKAELVITEGARISGSTSPHSCPRHVTRQSGSRTTSGPTSRTDREQGTGDQGWLQATCPTDSM